jgi:outer membrane protein TolC
MFSVGVTQAVKAGELVSIGKRAGSTLALVAIAAMLPCAQPRADTLPLSLTLAYQNNPVLNAQRAAVRATDETVPQALSGYRPRVNLTASAGEAYLDTLTKTSGPLTSPATYSHTSGNTAIQSYGGTITQTLLNGFGTASRTRQAEQLVSAARETLRLTEQTVLLNCRDGLHEPDPRRRPFSTCKAATSKCCRSSFARPAIVSEPAK